MTTIPKCQAKGGPSACNDPACPEKQFHAAISSAARNKLTAARNTVLAAVSTKDLFAAKYQYETAEFEYEGTQDGIRDLKEAVADETDSWEKGKLEAHLAMAEERFNATYGGTKIQGLASESLIPEGLHTYDVPTFSQEEGDSNNYYPATTGSKFTKYRDIKEIAKDIRADLAEAQAKNYLPKGVKFAVAVERGSWTSKVRVEIRGVPDEKIFTNEKDNWDRSFERQTADAKEIMNRVEGISKAYNQSRTNSQVDYFQETYYAQTSFETSRGLKYRLEEAAEAKKKRTAAKNESNIMATFKSSSVSSYLKSNKVNNVALTRDNLNISRIDGTNLVVVSSPKPEFEARAFRLPNDKKADTLVRQLTRSTGDNLDYYGKFEVK